MDFELDWLLKLRLIVARHGEQDIARWWNSNGQLGSRGASVLARGFPRTHYFAQARSVFAAAEARCLESFGLRGAQTLWRLDDEVEEAFEQQWEDWLDNAESWSIFFEEVAVSAEIDIRAVMLRFGMISDAQAAAIDRLAVDVSGLSIRVGEEASSRESIALLALGFSKGSPGNLVVPYTTAAR